eukprot:762062-Rhodomonas_salina.3
MNDKESTKTIREQGLAIMEVVREAVQDGNFELAFDSAEQAMELFDRARDNESMKEVTQTRAETLEKARCKVLRDAAAPACFSHSGFTRARGQVEESTRVARECMEAGWQALVQKQFEAARTSIQRSSALMEQIVVAGGQGQHLGSADAERTASDGDRQRRGVGSEAAQGADGGVGAAAGRPRAAVRHHPRARAVPGVDSARGAGGARGSRASDAAPTAAQGDRDDAEQ